VSLVVNLVGKPDASNPHVRFDERGWETGRRSASALAPILDSTDGSVMQSAVQRFASVHGNKGIARLRPH